MIDLSAIGIIIRWMKLQNSLQCMKGVSLLQKQNLLQENQLIVTHLVQRSVTSHSHEHENEMLLVSFRKKTGNLRYTTTTANSTFVMSITSKITINPGNKIQL